MSENPIQGIMGTTMEKIKEMVDVNTIIGDPVFSPDGTTFIPSGGSDLPTKHPKNTVGGGGGAGISIQPIAFLVVSAGNVKLLQMTMGENTANNIVNMVPEVVDKIGAMFHKDKATVKEVKTEVKTETKPAKE